METSTVYVVAQQISRLLTRHVQLFKDNVANSETNAYL